MPFKCLRRCRTLRIRNLRRLIDQLKHPRGTGDGILKLRHHTGYLIERFRILVCVAQKRRQLPDRKGSAYDRECSDNPDAGIDKAVDKPGCRVRDRRVEDRLQRCVGQSVIDLIKIRDNVRSLIICLDHPLALDHLIDQSCLLSPDCRLLLEH